MIDLSLLAAPAIIDELGFETILAQLKADAVARPSKPTVHAAAPPAKGALRGASTCELRVRITCESVGRKGRFGPFRIAFHLWSFIGGRLFDWWSRGELNPRPQAIAR